MSIEDNKALILRMYELLNRRELDAYIDRIAPDWVLHLTDCDISRDQERELDSRWFAAFPDVTSTIEDMVAEGDKVAFRVTWRGAQKDELMGMAPIVNRFEMTNTAIYRISGGKVAESWETLDNLRFLQHLGAIPSASAHK